MAVRLFSTPAAHGRLQRAAGRLAHSSVRPGCPDGRQIPSSIIRPVQAAGAHHPCPGRPRLRRSLRLSTEVGTASRPATEA